MASQEFDVAVIGAGVSGIAAARFYLAVHPECRLVILEKDSHPGGVWSSRRIYDHFWTQSVVGTVEYSDLPMARPPEHDTLHDVFKAKYLTHYLESYVDHHQFAGRSLRDRIQFGFEVCNVKREGGVWIITGRDSAHETKTFHASKLMVASGLTSAPNMPSLRGKENFEGLLMHQESFGQSSVLSSEEVRHVTVFGGAKSAADMVYASVKAGKSVSWIIRSSGTGPAFFFRPEGKGLYKNAMDLLSTRLIPFFSASLFAGDAWWTRFLHGSSPGRALQGLFWGSIDKETRAIANFARMDALNDFDKMNPQAPLFWQNGTAGLLNHPDFWDIIAQNVCVYEDDIFELDKRLIRLKNGKEVPTDALLCGTGWTQWPSFFDRDTRIALGLPHSLEDESAEEVALWSRLEKEADRKILDRFPQLADPPAHYAKPVEATPYRLYNRIAPLHDDSIVFIGYNTVLNYFRLAECQSIWATAYLDKKLDLPSLKERQEQVALSTAWSRRRYLSNGHLGNFLFFDVTSYTDRLLQEVGLSSHRRGWFADFFGPNRSRDLSGLWEEYVAKYGCDGKVREGRFGAAASGSLKETLD